MPLRPMTNSSADRGKTPDRPINLSGMSHEEEQAAVARMPKGAYYIGDDGKPHINENGPGGNPTYGVPKGTFLGKDGNFYTPDPYKKGSTPRLDFHQANGWYLKSYDGQYVHPDGKIARGVGPEAEQARGQASGALANINRGIPLGDELQGGLTGAAGVVQGLLGDPHHPIRNLSDVGAEFKDGMRQQRETEDAFTNQRPAVANLLRGTGAASTILLPGPKGLIGGSRAGNAARGAVTAGVYGTGMAALDRGSLGERLKGAEDAANPVKNPLGYGLGAAAGALAPGNAPRGAKTYNTATDQGLLQSEGAVLTPGQRIGGWANDLEQKMTSWPILGDAITSARRHGFGSWNRVEGNRALAPIGESIPPGMEAGTEMTAFVRDRLKAAYNEAHDMVPQVIEDAGFKAGMKTALDDAPLLPPDKMKELDNLLKNRVEAQLQKGPLTGQAVKVIVEDLGKEQKSFSGGGPQDQRIASIIGNVKNELKGLVARQNPAAGDLLARTDKGYAQYKRIERAASSVKNADGVYTPAQMFNAVKAADTTSSGFATGESHGYDMARAAKRVMGDTYPDSGTGGRVAAAAAGAGVGTSVLGLMQGNVVPAAVTAGTGAALTAGAIPYWMIGNAARRGVTPPAQVPPNVLALQAQLAQRLSRGAGAVPMLSAPQQPLAIPR